MLRNPRQHASSLRSPVRRQLAACCVIAPRIPISARADTNPKSDQGRGQGTSKGGARTRPGPRSRNEEEELVKMTARLSLHHKDSLAMTRANRGFVLRFGSGPLTLIAALVELSGRWKSPVARAQGHMPDFIPLRVTLFRCVVSELQKRFDKLRGDPDMQKSAAHHNPSRQLTNPARSDSACSGGTARSKLW